MFKLSEAELDESLAALQAHGEYSFFPPKPEWDAVQADWNSARALIADIDLDTYAPLDPLLTYAAKGATRVRPVSFLHVQDTIIYTALVIILRDKIETERSPAQLRKVFSYRAGGVGVLYRSRGAYEAYRTRTEQRVALRKTRFVTTLDIADFFASIYQHRLQNALEAADPQGRGREATRVLMKILNKLSGGKSYGIPTGPFASRNLAEAVLIDVDAALQAKDIDYVRWMDDFTIFTRSREEAEQIVGFIAAWLHDKHGLSLNYSKTRVYEKAAFLTDVWKTYDEDRDEFRRLVQELNAAVEYDDEEDEDVVNEENLERIFELSLTIEDEPKYGLVRFLLERALTQDEVSEATQRQVLRRAMGEVWKLMPVFDALAYAIVETGALGHTETLRFTRRVFRQLNERDLFVPGQFVCWLCWLTGASALRALSPELRTLAENANDDCVRREALIALSKVGSRGDVLNVKDRYKTLPRTVRPGLALASNLLGADERRFWRRELGISDYYDRLLIN